MALNTTHFKLACLCNGGSVLKITKEKLTLAIKTLSSCKKKKRLQMKFSWSLHLAAIRWTCALARILSSVFADYCQYNGYSLWPYSAHSNVERLRGDLWPLLLVQKGFTVHTLIFKFILLCLRSVVPTWPTWILSAKTRVSLNVYKKESRRRKQHCCDCS